MAKQKLLYLLSGIALITGLFIISPQQAHADNCPLKLTPANSDNPDFEGDVTLTTEEGQDACFTAGGTYSILFLRPGVATWDDSGNSPTQGGYRTSQASADGKSITFSMSAFGQWGKNAPAQNTYIGKKDQRQGDWTIIICLQTNTDHLRSCTDGNNDDVVGRKTFTIGSTVLPDDYTLPTIVKDDAAMETCSFKIDSDVPLHATGLEAGTQYYWWMVEDPDNHHGDVPTDGPVPDGQTEADFTADASSFHDVGSKKICIDKKDANPRHETEGNCIQLEFSAAPPTSKTSCEAPKFETKYPPCAAEIGPEGCTEINTALGVLATKPDTFISTIFAIFLGISGGIALLLIIRSGYQLLTSQGNAEKIKEAQDRITSAIVGLLFALFSLVILESIGIDILHLPGLSH